MAPSLPLTFVSIAIDAAVLGLDWTYDTAQ